MSKSVEFETTHQLVTQNSSLTYDTTRHTR